MNNLIFNPLTKPPLKSPFLAVRFGRAALESNVDFVEFMSAIAAQVMARPRVDGGSPAIGEGPAHGVAEHGFAAAGAARDFRPLFFLSTAAQKSVIDDGGRGSAEFDLSPWRVVRVH